MRQTYPHAYYRSEPDDLPVFKPIKINLYKIKAPELGGSGDVDDTTVSCRLCGEKHDVCDLDSAWHCSECHQDDYSDYRYEQRVDRELMG